MSFIGESLAVQPRINDALFQAFDKFHDEKLRIQELKGTT